MKLNENLSLVAEKVKGYASWSIKSQQIAGKARGGIQGHAERSGRQSRVSHDACDRLGFTNAVFPQLVAFSAQP